MTNFRRRQNKVRDALLFQSLRSLLSILSIEYARQVIVVRPNQLSVSPSSSEKGWKFLRANTNDNDRHWLGYLNAVAGHGLALNLFQKLRGSLMGISDVVSPGRAHNLVEFH
ncbi:MAG: hypothetical protein DMG32_07600 [Acidobacteria bacterium]|nr:MAG: hypothetical protein DMG32_07600 [Acidobacteriota bacterium]